MTALERQLGTTFRAARWATSDGEAVCRKCFDGADLERVKPSAADDPAVRIYWCAVCHWRFSDLTDTVFATYKPSPLAILAYLALTKDPRNIAPSPKDLHRYWSLVERIRHSKLAADWRDALAKARISAAKILESLKAQRRAA